MINSRGRTPACRVTLDGVDITANLIPAPFGMVLEGGGVALPGGLRSGGPLLALTVTDNEDRKSDSVELSIDNRDYYAAPQKGSRFQVWLGYVETGLVDMGTYQVESWTKRGPPRELSISAKAAGFGTPIKAKRSRSYHGKTAGAIIQQIAGYYGLGTIIHSTIESLPIGHIDQSNESDVHFLTRLAGRVGARFKIANDTIIFNDASGSTQPNGGEASSFDWTLADVVSWSAEGSERGSYDKASAYYQDTAKGKRAKVSTDGSDDDDGDDDDDDTSETPEPTSAASAASSESESTVSGGIGSDAAASSGTGTGAGTELRDRKLYKTKEEAKRAAKAHLSESNRGKVSYSCAAPGKPEVFAGAFLNVTGHDVDVDGRFKIKTVSHTLDENGLSISISAESVNDAGGSKAPLTGSGKASSGSETGEPSPIGEGGAYSP